MTEAQILQIFGIAYLSMGFGMVINGGYYYKVFKEIQNNPSIMYIFGVFALFLGWILITLYGCKSGGWGIIVPIFGWAGFIKGILILIFPTQMANLTKIIVSKESCVAKLGVMMVIFGLLLGYVGFTGLV